MFQNLVRYASSHLQTNDMNARSELGFSWERLQLPAASDQPTLAFWDGWGWGVWTKSRCRATPEDVLHLRMSFGRHECVRLLYRVWKE